MMTKKDWLKVIVLILVPVNVWLGVLYYLHWQKRGRGELVETFRFNTVVRVTHFAEKWWIKEGQQLVYPFPVGNTPTLFLGVSPPVGQGRPVLFLNICRITSEEVWRPALQEALASSPSLHIVLLFDTRESSGEEFERDMKRLREMLNRFPSHRISAIAGDWIGTAFGGFLGGVLVFLCDGEGIVRAVEPYPDLKLSPSWEEEVKDWRPKLHQAVKRALEKFFGKPSGKQDG
jgi:hypothetical protein